MSGALGARLRPRLAAYLVAAAGLDAACLALPFLILGFLGFAFPVPCAALDVNTHAGAQAMDSEIDVEE